MSPFGTISAPSLLRNAYAVLYLFGALWAAVSRFKQRDI